jgi:hypothetical protein
LLVGDSVSFVPQLLQVMHERLEAPRVTSDRVQDTPRARVEGACVLAARAAISFGAPKYWPPLLATRHLVAPSPARPAAAVAAASGTAATLLEAI